MKNTQISLFYIEAFILIVGDYFY